MKHMKYLWKQSIILTWLNMSSSIVSKINTRIKSCSSVNNIAYLVTILPWFPNFITIMIDKQPKIEFIIKSTWRKNAFRIFSFLLHIWHNSRSIHRRSRTWCGIGAGHNLTPRLNDALDRGLIDLVVFAVWWWRPVAEVGIVFMADASSSIMDLIVYVLQRKRKEVRITDIYRSLRYTNRLVEEINSFYYSRELLCEYMVVL